MNLREEIRRLAEEAWNKAWSDAYAQNTFVSVPKSIESAILEGVKLVLEREPSIAMLELVSGGGIFCGDKVMPELRDKASRYYRAMTQELLKELE